MNPELAKERRSIVLDRMAQAGFISASEAERGRNSPGLKPATPKYFNSSAPYFTTWIAQELPKFLTPEQLEVGGVRCAPASISTGKRKLNRIRANAPFNTEGAMVSIDPGNGLVRVMVGGKDFSKSQFNAPSWRCALRAPPSSCFPTPRPLIGG